MPQTADELVMKVVQDQKKFKAVQHLTANHQVTLDGDRAKCLANFRAQHLLAKDPNNFWTLVGRYVYNLVRTQVGWKIRGCVISVY
jgi:hypothetical protein